MKIETKIFGEIEISEDKIVTFQDGIIGFPEMKRFALLHDEERGAGAGIRFLQSLDEPGFAMPVMDPLVVKPDYAPVLSQEELEELGVERSEDLCFYALCVARNPVAGSTVNLRCPVAINDRTRQAVQVILDTEEYQMHHLLSEFSRKKGEEQVC